MKIYCANFFSGHSKSTFKYFRNIFSCSDEKKSDHIDKNMGQFKVVKFKTPWKLVKSEK